MPGIAEHCSAGGDAISFFPDLRPRECASDVSCPKKKVVRGRSMAALSVNAFLQNEASVQQRAVIEDVRAQQRAMGMEPRDDSALTVQYARGEADTLCLYVDPADVANDLVAVDLVYQTTLYQEIVEDTLRFVANWLHRKYRLPWGDTWAIVRAYVPTMVKLYCIDSCVCRQQPARLAWGGGPHATAST